jgi:hypothetical protein
MLLNRLRGNPKATVSTPHAPRSILPDNIPREFQVLLSACRVFLGTEEPACLEAKLAQGPDWDKLLRLANRHGVMPLLYRSISKNCPQAVPQEWLRRLILQYMQNAARNMKMTAELLRIIDLFEVNGIAAIPFKGPALAQQIYGDITLRSFVDLDIIVHREDVLRAKDILIANDYLPEVKLKSSQETAFQKTECEYSLSHKTGNFKVELHWKLAPSRFSIPFDDKGIWSRIEHLSLEGNRVNSLSTEDLLVAMCIHGAKHHWNQLKLICEVSGLIDIRSELDWSRTFSYAKELRVDRILMLGLKLAKDLQEIDIPLEISKRIENCQAVDSLASNILLQNLVHMQNSSYLWDEFYFWIQARESLLD